jgi:hypothetical protein
MTGRDPAYAGADARRSRLRRGLFGLGALVAATLGPVGPVLADGASHGLPQRWSYVGLWGYFTTCRASNDLMISYDRRTAGFPHETVARQAAGCRVLSRQGAAPRWTLELSCRVWTGAEPPPVIRVRQVILMRDNGRTLDIESLNRTTGESRTFGVFYCRQHHEPELMPLGILEPPE